jgi:hypothetical protein
MKIIVTILQLQRWSSEAQGLIAQGSGLIPDLAAMVRGNLFGAGLFFYSF